MDKVFRVLQGDWDTTTVAFMRKLFSEKFLPEGWELELRCTNLADEMLALAAKKPFDLLLLYPGNNLNFPDRMYSQASTREEKRLLFIRMMKETFNVPIFNIPCWEGDPYVVNQIRELSDFYRYCTFKIDEMEVALIETLHRRKHGLPRSNWPV